ncbi:MAG: hypothetical protein HYZ44_10185 [Bacteroidetes bacterium]|nr:hypothetical protein [Bacteroidota bacterium]
MRKYLIFVFLAAPTIGFSQCDDFDKLDFGGTLSSKTRNYIPFDLHIEDTVHYCCDIRKIKPYSDFILSNARKFIVARTNEVFYGKLKINQVEVNYPDSVKIVYTDQSLYNLSNFNISYWITYTYSDENIEYGFGLEFDKNGKMISENKFPDFSKNKTADMLTDICAALSIVRGDKRFSKKEVDIVELAYLDDANSFCWLIKEKLKIECGSRHYSLDIFYVNANTNKLEAVKQETGFIIVDCAKPRE